MALMNVTTMHNDTMGTNPFDYLNSEINETFPLYFPNGKVAPFFEADPLSLSVSESFGDYLLGTEGTSNMPTIGNETTTDNFEGQRALYPNPFGISFTEWASIGKALHTASNSRQ
jgi:hypothetical protein